jgi:hypothetical protein
MEYTEKNSNKFISRAFLCLKLFAVCLLFSGCGPSAPDKFFKVPTVATNLSNHIVVASQAAQSVVLLEQTGGFLREIVVYDGATSDAPAGIGIYDSTKVLVSVEGVDRVTITDASIGTASATTLILDSNLTGTMAGVARLSGGDILVAETNNVERFSAAGSRVAVAWPQALQTAGTGLDPLVSGGFVHCSTGSPGIRTYTSTGAVISALVVSGIAGTTAANDCSAARDGRVGVVWNGTTDTARIYTNQNLTVVSCNFTNAALMPDPRRIAFRPNGNAIIADGTNNILVEIDTTCTLVRTYSSSSLATVTGLKVFP